MRVGDKDVHYMHAISNMFLPTYDVFSSKIIILTSNLFVSTSNIIKLTCKVSYISLEMYSCMKMFTSVKLPECSSCFDV